MRRSNFENFKKRSEEIYKDISGNPLYVYPLQEYIGRRIKMKIYCPIHDHFFFKTPSEHFNGRGCPKCSVEKSHDKLRDTLEEFVEKANKIHNNLYIYPEQNYKCNKQEVIIECKIHGIFPQLSYLHLRGSGCPECNNHISHGENATIDILKENNIKFIRQYIFKNCKNIRVLPFDFYLTKYNSCVEYDGKFHYESIKHFGGDEKLNYTKNNDRIKTNFCKENGINLIRISYKEKNIKKFLIRKLKLINLLK